MSQPSHDDAAPHAARYFEQARTLPASERELWLTHLSTNEPAMAQLVRQMLRQAEIGPATEMRGGAEPAPGLQADAVVGDYRLLQEIGQGGMSSVWLAERCDGHLERQVALKLPFIGQPRLHLAERFRRERDILAALTHPNIARLYDAGVTQSGQPFLAMEYVEGSAITSYCESQRLTIRERVALLLQVLDAVQFAHAQLIVHRDLKPSNILVTAAGRVVLLDFGIAKLLSEEPEAQSLTQIAGRAFTPDYASPEQISGLPLGTATDIYSLGVLLHELLTGAHPYAGQRTSLAQLQQAILTRDPARPSQLPLTDAIAEARRSTTRKLASTLSGDLDTIVLMTLKKEPTERYASISAFAQDLRNYLADLPVSARPDSRWYRCNRFVTRHRLPVAAGSIAILAIVAGAAVALWQMRVAAQERDRALTLADRNAAVTEFMGALITETAESDKPITISEMLARGERLARSDRNAPPENRAAVLAMIAIHYNSVDDDNRTIALLDEAIGLLANTADTGLRSQMKCARAMHLADRGQRDAALRTIEQELGTLADDPENAAYCLLYRSFIKQYEDDGAPALHDAVEGLARFRAAPRKAAADEALFFDAMAAAYSMQGRNREADQAYAQAMRTYAATGRERSPNTITVRNNWAVISSNAGVPKRSLELYDETLAITADRADGNQPMQVILNRGRALAMLGRYDEAVQSYQRALQLLGPEPNLLPHSLCLLGLAYVAIERGDATAANGYLQQTAALYGGTIPDNAPVWQIHALMRARTLVVEQRPADALVLFAQVMAKNPRNSNLVEALLAKADAELRVGQAALAAQDASRALQLSQTLQGGLPYSNRTGLAWLAVGRAAQQSGDAARAREAFQAAAQHLNNTVDENHWARIAAAAALSRTSPPK